MTRRSLLDRPLVVPHADGGVTLDLGEESVRRLFETDTGIDPDPLWDGAAFGIADPHLIHIAMAWQQSRSQLIFMADALSTSIALDSNFRGSHGNFTQLGALEAVAKHDRDESAIRGLAEAMTCFIGSTRLYDGCSICAVPRSPDKAWHLPTQLARAIAQACAMPDLSDQLWFTNPKPPIKTIQFDEKGASLDRAGIEIHVAIDRPVLLIDDKYQSGTTAGFVGAALMAHGARTVHGLFCVKTWRDRDNMSPPGAEPG